MPMRLLALPAPAEEAAEAALRASRPESSRPALGRGELGGLLGADRQRDGACVGTLDLRRVYEPQVSARRLDHEPVEDVLAVIVEHIVDLADLDAVGRVHRRPALDRRVVNGMAFVHRPYTLVVAGSGHGALGDSVCGAKGRDLARQPAALPGERRLAGLLADQPRLGESLRVRLRDGVGMSGIGLVVAGDDERRDVEELELGHVLEGAIAWDLAHRLGDGLWMTMRDQALARDPDQRVAPLGVESVAFVGAQEPLHPIALESVG